MIIKAGDELVSKVNGHYSLQKGQRFIVIAVNPRVGIIRASRYSDNNVLLFYERDINTCFDKIYKSDWKENNSRVKLRLKTSDRFSLVYDTNCRFPHVVFYNNIYAALLNCDNKIEVCIEYYYYDKEEDMLIAIFNAVQNCLREKRKDAEEEHNKRANLKSLAKILAGGNHVFNKSKGLS